MGGCLLILIRMKKLTGWTIALLVLTVVGWTAWAIARFTVGGYCARPELAENFTKESYLGRWYEMYAGKTVPFEANKDCITATYADKDGTNIRVDNQSYRISDGSFSNWEDGTPPAGRPRKYFKAHCTDWIPGHCQVKPFWWNPWSDYKVVAYDPDPTNGYSIVYGCDTFLGGAIKLDYFWALTRSALVIDTPAWTNMKSTIFDLYRTKLPQPDYDPEANLEQTI